MKLNNSNTLPIPLSDTKGLSLIEILVSMLLVMIIGTVAVTIGSGTLLNAQANQDRARALSYTLEALEEIRTIRDSEPYKLFDLTDDSKQYTLADDTGLVAQSLTFDESNMVASEVFKIANNFYRVIQLTTPADCSSQCKEIRVTTYFKEKSELRSVETTAYLTDWQ